MQFTETAYAKINLALHVRKRRDDGYHEIETLFAFVDQGDVLTAEPAQEDRLGLSGEFVDALSAPFGNLVTQALGVLPRANGLSIMLEKNLPVAAGLGGGSADAGAIFRLIEQLHGLPDDWQERATKLGADVPACVRSQTAVGRGIGDILEPVENTIAGMPVLLVNPRTILQTGPVFRGWDGVDRGELPTGDPKSIAQAGRNDLEAPAIELCPAIGEILKVLGETDPWLARMSGSGASCFALYETQARLDLAAQKLKATHPEWWMMQGRIR